MTAPIAFLAPLLDVETGKIRDATIEIGPGLLFVRMSAGRPRREDGPHHACADFTEQMTEIAAAIVDANEAHEGQHDTTKGTKTT